MQTTENVYSIGKVKQLIDLNGDSVNFEVSFNVESETGEAFDALVVDQTTLDNNSKIEYKKADEGKLSGTITNDKNVYQNYFLILKADKDVNCKVSISKKELPKTSLPISKNSGTTHSMVSETERNINWVKVLLVFGGISLASYFIYNFIKNKEQPLHNNLLLNTDVVRSVSSRSPSILSDSQKIVEEMGKWKRSPSN